MREVEVQTETPEAAGWSYVIQVRSDGRESSHRVHLSWLDHDYWSGGALAPSRVIQAVIEYLLDHAPEALPARFDAARARRIAPQIDQALRTPE